MEKRMNRESSMNLKSLTRRHFFEQAGFGIGGAALASLMGPEAQAQVAQQLKTHFAPKAKNVIFLFMAGGPSQLDMFDPKPALNKYDNQPIPAEHRFLADVWPWQREP